ncbi:MAG: sugar isomerase [Candidatus Hydrogenedentes bacterium]|nr:sugar isomerase [Candidatus Hydrogenedentota bacterium]
MTHTHSGCCGCHGLEMGRRSFLAAASGTTLGMTASAVAAPRGRGTKHERVQPVIKKQELVVQPVLLHQQFVRREATSWRPWGGLQNAGGVAREGARIESELKQLRSVAEFPLRVLPLRGVTSKAEAESVRATPADVNLIYAASGDGGVLEALLAPERHNMVFVRHESGPVYLWYEIIHPRMLRKTVDEYGEPGLTNDDIVVDDTDDLLWRLRGLYALKNSVGSRIVAIGGASGWGHGGRNAPQLARDKWKLDIVDVSYDDLAKRITAMRGDSANVDRYRSEAADYLRLPKTKLETKMDFVSGAFLLRDVFERVMAEADAAAITVNECMSTIMPMACTTACLTLTLINDAGMLAFCESDFVVIPSGILLHHVASTPVFLQDPTYPHHGVITLAHCTAPRKMDGKRLEPARIMTHFESDYGAAPKVEMKVGQVVTVIDPDFAEARWLGFRGYVQDNPFMDICRSQVDVEIDGDCRELAQEMRGFHWMLAYGDHLKEAGYALGKLGIGWRNLSVA